MKQIIKYILFALASGLLLVLSFPYPDAGFLAFFALIPLLIVVYQTTPLKSFLFGWVAGMVFFAGISYWFAIYGALPYILIVAGMGFFIALFSLGSSFVVRKASPFLRLLFLPSFWVALEFLHSELGSWSYPYGVLGYSQHNYLPVIQIASILGVYGVSFLIVLVNVALAELCLGTVLFREPSPRGDSRHTQDSQGFPALARIIVAIVLILSLGYGLVRIRTAPDSGEKMRVAVVQVSIPESLDRLGDEKGAMEKYRQVTFQAAERRPDLIVMPESTLPAYVTEDDPLFLSLEEWARETNTPLLVGVPLIDKDGKAFNTAQLFSSRGKVLGKYAKIYPVPFGEFVPIRSVTERVYEKTAMLGDITPGTNPTIFQLLPLRTPNSELRTFGVLLCSESSYSHLARRMVERGANMIFVLTNDAWFSRTAEAEQHFNMSKFRAVENGCYLIQAANPGISGVVTSKGRVVKRSKLFEIVTFYGQVYFLNGRTFYTKYGYLFSYLTLLISLFALIPAGLSHR